MGSPPRFQHYGIFLFAGKRFYRIVQDLLLFFQRIVLFGEIGQRFVGRRFLRYFRLHVLQEFSDVFCMSELVHLAAYSVSIL